MKCMMIVIFLAVVLWINPAFAIDPCNCQGHAGPGGPAYDGPGGPCYSGPGGTGENCPDVCR